MNFSTIKLFGALSLMAAVALTAVLATAHNPKKAGFALVTVTPPPEPWTYSCVSGICSASRTIQSAGTEFTVQVNNLTNVYVHSDAGDVGPYSCADHDFYEYASIAIDEGGSTVFLGLPGLNAACEFVRDANNQ